jgi:hypothetical protein
MVRICPEPRRWGMHNPMPELDTTDRNGSEKQHGKTSLGETMT